MSRRGLTLPRAIAVVLAARPGGLTLEGLLVELARLRERGFLDEEELSIGRLRELLELGRATRVITVENGRYRLDDGVKRDRLYWGIIESMVREIYGSVRHSRGPAGAG